MDLKEKVVVITGAANGLGRELVIAFESEGAKIIASDIDKIKLDILSEEIEIIPVLADVSKEEDIKKISSRALFDLGRIDIWINNAGIWLPHARAEELSLIRIKKMFDVNVFGLMAGSRSALNIMKRQNSGIILNIISISALEVHLDSAAYGASKRAADGFTKGLRLEVETYEGKNIKILSAYPDAIKTELFNEQKPSDFDNYLESSDVAQKIVSNLKLDNPEEEQIIS